MNLLANIQNNITPAICAWCKKKLNDFEYKEDTKVSHGICEECEEKHFKEDKTATYKKVIIVAIKKLLK